MSPLCSSFYTVLAHNLSAYFPIKSVQGLFPLTFIARFFSDKIGTPISLLYGHLKSFFSPSGSPAAIVRKLINGELA